MADAGKHMMSKDEYLDALVRDEAFQLVAVQLGLAAREMVERHRREAVSVGFKQCGCEDCKPFREIIEKVNHAL